MPQEAPQATSSHMMKTTKRGRPFLKVRCTTRPSVRATHPAIFILQDTLDLFATLVVSLELNTNRQYFRSFPNSFTTYVNLFNIPRSPTHLCMPFLQRRCSTELGVAQVLTIEPRT